MENGDESTRTNTQKGKYVVGYVDICDLVNEICDGHMKAEGDKYIFLEGSIIDLKVTSSAGNISKLRD